MTEALATCWRAAACASSALPARIASTIRCICLGPSTSRPGVLIVIERAARQAMMLGATHAGLAVSNTSTALIHGLSRPIGAFFHVPHGLSNAMLLPLVTEYSLSAAPAGYAAAARALGWATGATGDEEAGRALVRGFRDLNDRLKVPTSKAYGLDEDTYFRLRPEMASQALASGTPGNNPRIPTEDEIVRLYEIAWDGGQLARDNVA